MTPADHARPLLVFADDWGRHPSSCQHLVGKLLDGREVVWVNTIGTRPPRLDWSTAKRVAGKLREWVVGPAVPDVGTVACPVPHDLGEGSRRLAVPDVGGVVECPAQPDLQENPSPRVLAPKMWPSFRSRFGRSLNRRLLVRALRPAVERLPQPPVAVTTLPLVADLIGPLPVHRWVYYCVDDFSQWPGYDGETMLRMERELVPKVDAVVAVSETLVKHVADLGKPAHLLTHGVDLDHWRAPVPPGEPPEFAGLDRPLVLFWGVIDRRMDTAFVRHLSSTMAAGTIVLVGPKEDPDPELLALPRVAVRPAVPYARLPALAAAAEVLVMPYADLPVTRAIQPLKLKEYLATGKPAVVRDLPATRPWADACDVVESADQFTAKVFERIGGEPPDAQRAARRRLEAEGWAEKAKQFERWLDGPGAG